MALVAETMAATMLTRALAQSLLDKPPHFALSRSYLAIARGVVASLQDPGDTIITASYGPGQPAIGFGTATAIGFNGLDADRYSNAVFSTSGFVGPFALPYFFGIGGIIEYFAPTAQTLDLLVPTGNGVGLIPGGGIVLNADACFERMKEEADSEGLMTAQLGVHLDDPLGSVPDPVFGTPVFLGELFSQAEILLRSVATQLSLELLSASRGGIPVTGVFNPLAPPITGTTITTVLL